MSFTTKQIQVFSEKYAEVREGFQTLLLSTVVTGQESQNAAVKEHLLHGVARRLRTLDRCLANIFDAFPLTTTHPIKSGVLLDVQINLQSYVMNLYGIFDNWAWAFVLRHNLLQRVGGKHGVGLFIPSTKKYLAEPLRSYLNSEAISNWHEVYLKSFRDALAHRIPLYVPPAEFTQEEGNSYNQLESEKVHVIRSMNWPRLEEIHNEQAALGKPSFVFLHSFNEEPPKPIIFHPQLLTDGLSVIEFGELFMKHWERLTNPEIRGTGL